MTGSAVRAPHGPAKGDSNRQAAESAEKLVGEVGAAAVTGIWASPRGQCPRNARRATKTAEPAGAGEGEDGQTDI